MDLADLMQIALGVLSIATLAGLGFTWGRVKGLEQRATSAESESAELRERIEFRDSVIDRLRDEKSSLEVEHAHLVAELRAEVGALGRVVTGEAYLVAISDRIEAHHAAAEAHWARMEGLLRVLDTATDDA